MISVPGIVIPYYTYSLRDMISVPGIVIPYYAYNLQPT